MTKSKTKPLVDIMDVRLEYVRLAIQSLQKHYSPAVMGSFQGGSYPKQAEVVTVRSVDEVLTAAEKIRKWCEK